MPLPHHRTICVTDCEQVKRGCFVHLMAGEGAPGSFETGRFIRRTIVHPLLLHRVQTLLFQRQCLPYLLGRTEGVPEPARTLQSGPSSAFPRESSEGRKEGAVGVDGENCDASGRRASRNGQS